MSKDERKKQLKIIRLINEIAYTNNQRAEGMLTAYNYIYDTNYILLNHRVSVIVDNSVLGYRDVISYVFDKNM